MIWGLSGVISVVPQNFSRAKSRKGTVTPEAYSYYTLYRSSFPSVGQWTRSLPLRAAAAVAQELTRSCPPVFLLCPHNSALIPATELSSRQQRDMISTYPGTKFPNKCNNSRYFSPCSSFLWGPGERPGIRRTSLAKGWGASAEAEGFPGQKA